MEYLKPSATFLNATIVFRMDGGDGQFLRLLVSRLRLFGDFFVFECEPGQDTVWKNLRGGVQHIKRSQLQIGTDAIIA